MTRNDVLTIKTYLFSLKPVRYVPPGNDLAFRFNQRYLMRFWNLLFNPDQRFEPNTSQAAEWNRGAYLSEALGHCGDCHTPRNLLQGLSSAENLLVHSSKVGRPTTSPAIPGWGIGDW